MPTYTRNQQTGKLRRVHRREGAPRDPDTSGLVRRCRMAFEAAGLYSMTGSELLVAVFGEGETRITFGPDPRLWAYEMARMLRPFGIAPKPTRVRTATGSRSTTGYRVEQFRPKPAPEPEEPIVFELADLTPEDVAALRRTEFAPAIAALNRAGLLHRVPRPRSRRHCRLPVLGEHHHGQQQPEAAGEQGCRAAPG